MAGFICVYILYTTLMGFQCQWIDGLPVCVDTLPLDAKEGDN